MEIKNNTDIEKTNMENYKVILVDDEEEVIDAIKSRILWEQLGLQIVGSATNGVKALYEHFCIHRLIFSTVPDHSYKAFLCQL